MPSDLAARADPAFRELVSWDNLLASYRAAARGKRGSEAVARFEFRLGDHLRRLQQALWDQSWQPGAYQNFFVHEPKRRLISAAPFVDRIVHHALCRVIEPRFEHHFIAGSYANRIGKGTHRAVRAAAQAARQYRFVLRLDVREHFASIDHAVLRRALFRRVPEPGLQHLIDLILESGAEVHEGAGQVPLLAGDDLLALCRPRGLPIGNLTSQFASNVLMNALDQHATRRLGCARYLRYVDDVAVFGNGRAELLRQRDDLVRFLNQRLRLTVHQGAAQVQPCAQGFPWLGFVVYPDGCSVKARKVVVATRRLKRSHAAWRSGRRPFATFDAQVQGWINHVRQVGATGLRQCVLSRLPIDGARLQPRGSARR